MSTIAQSASTAIILYGRSLLLDSVELILRQSSTTELHTSLIRHADTNTPITLHNVPTGTIIYDQNSADPTAVYQLISNYPGWQLVGLTAATDELLIINSQKKNGRLPAVLSNIIQE